MAERKTSIWVERWDEVSAEYAALIGAKTLFLFGRNMHRENEDGSLAIHLRDVDKRDAYWYMLGVIEYTGTDNG